MGSIMSSEPELRSRAKEIGPISGKIVAKVNALSVEEQKRQKWKKFDLHVEKKEKNKKKEGLAELPGSHDNVVMRFCSKPKWSFYILDMQEQQFLIVNM